MSSISAGNNRLPINTLHPGEAHAVKASGASTGGTIITPGSKVLNALSRALAQPSSGSALIAADCGDAMEAFVRSDD